MPKAATSAAGNHADNTQVSWMAATEVVVSVCSAQELRNVLGLHAVLTVSAGILAVQEQGL